jgi:hypothetical protein
MNKVKGFALCLALVFAVVSLAAQSPEWLWEGSFGEPPFSGKGLGIIVDSLGNSFVSGSITSSGNLTGPPFVAKYDAYGSRQWANTLGIAGSDIYDVRDIVTDNEGFLYITGKTVGYNF